MNNEPAPLADASFEAASLSPGRLRVRQSGETLTVELELRRERWAIGFGLGWLVFWWTAFGFGLWRAVTRHVQGDPIGVKTAGFLGMMLVVGIFVVVHFVRLLGATREVEFSPEGICVREKRAGRAQETRYSAEKIRRLRSTYPGWRESLLFDVGDIPTGIDLPIDEGERKWLLAQPAVRRFLA